MSRDRASLLRALDRELAQVGPDDKERSEAIRAEIARIEALPVESSPARDEPTSTEREAGRLSGYLAALRREREAAIREGGDRVAEVEAEIGRVEGLVHPAPPAKAERAVNTPKAERAVNAPS